jgi:hypothetical protein
MKDFTFKVKLAAVVRVRAANETVARRVLPSVLSSPGTVDIKVANENNAALGLNALVTDVDFAITGPLKLAASPLIRTRPETIL